MKDPIRAIHKAYKETDRTILERSQELGDGGSTAVTAVLVNGQRLIIANVGDSRAVLSRSGDAIQLSVDHEPKSEKTVIESRGGFVTSIPGKNSSKKGNPELAFIAFFKYGICGG
jgi:protein phosphatase 1L